MYVNVDTQVHLPARRGHVVAAGATSADGDDGTAGPDPRGSRAETRRAGQARRRLPNRTQEHQ